MKAIRFLHAAVAGAALCLAVNAFAHDAKPKYGGIVRTVGDLHFELVAKEGNAIIHVDDHSKPVPTAGMSGKLTLLIGKETSEAPLQAAGENRLEAKGVKLASGAKVVASIVRAGKTITVRFAVK
jgi:hypothetical protein